MVFEMRSRVRRTAYSVWYVIPANVAGPPTLPDGLRFVDLGVDLGISLTLQVYRPELDHPEQEHTGESQYGPRTDRQLVSGAQEKRQH
jgi:hypothetical protein